MLSFRLFWMFFSFSAFNSEVLSSVMLLCPLRTFPFPHFRYSSYNLVDLRVWNKIRFFCPVRNTLTCHCKLGETLTQKTPFDFHPKGDVERKKCRMVSEIILEIHRCIYVETEGKKERQRQKVRRWSEDGKRWRERDLWQWWGKEEESPPSSRPHKTGQFGMTRL